MVVIVVVFLMVVGYADDGRFMPIMDSSVEL